MATKGISIQVEGLKEAIAKMKADGSSKLAQVESGVKKAGFYVEGEVKESIAGNRAEKRSVDTGRFLNSVKTEFPAPYTANVETNVSYAPALEYGTTRMAPRSHFRNTASRATPQVTNIIKAEIK